LLPVLVLSIIGSLLVSCAKHEYYEFNSDYERQVNQILQRPGLVIDRVVDRRHCPAQEIGLLSPGLIGTPKTVKLDHPANDFVHESLTAMLTDRDAPPGTETIPVVVYIDSFYVTERFASVLKRVEFHAVLTFVIGEASDSEQVIPITSMRFKEWAVVTPDEAEDMMYHSLRQCVDRFLMRYDQIMADSLDSTS